MEQDERNYEDIGMNTPDEREADSFAAEGQADPASKEKKGFADVVAGAGAWAAKMAGNAKKAVVNALDRNDDGKLNLKDISVLADRIAEKRERERLEREFNHLRPIFKDTITDPEFVLPKLIRIAEIDKKHADSEVCKDSIGFRSEHLGVQILTIYPHSTAFFGLGFYPDRGSEIYYVDPSNRDNYIALDDYFKYMRLAKVNELQMIAQALGAKHFRVTYVEQDKLDADAKAGRKAVLNINTENKNADIDREKDFEFAARQFHKVEVAAEMDCLGHDPVEPNLVYLKADPNIEAMIRMRLSRNAPIHQKVSVSLISTSGIKVADAGKIDAALTALHYTSKAFVQAEAQREARTILEYEIDY